MSTYCIIRQRNVNCYKTLPKTVAVIRDLIRYRGNIILFHRKRSVDPFINNVVEQ